MYHYQPSENKNLRDWDGPYEVLDISIPSERLYELVKRVGEVNEPFTPPLQYDNVHTALARRTKLNKAYVKSLHGGVS